ncbi:hypothetical protein PINS_up019696 [Pythium insidiosum]|nr:hypothetical protein PINS_up019696 [Pythium insidiosum]
MAPPPRRPELRPAALVFALVVTLATLAVRRPPTLSLCITIRNWSNWSLCESAQRAQDLPPNALFGTCFDDAWVTKMEQKMGVFASDRDARGRLVNPYLRPALKHRRYTVR